MLPLLVVCLVASALAQQAAPPCLFETKDPATGQTYKYDFTSMAAASPAEYLPVFYSEDNTRGTLNLCAPLTGVCATQSTPLCMETLRATQTSLGTMASWRVGPYTDPFTNVVRYGGGALVTISGGESCSRFNSVPGQAYLFLKCDPTVNVRQTPVVITDIDPSSGIYTPCRYYVGPIVHSAFCPLANDAFDCTQWGLATRVPAPDSPADGWVFVIIVLCGLFLYFVLGIVILKFALHKEGRDVVPNVEFWAALPGLVVDGIKFVFRKIAGCCGSNSYESH